MCKVSDETGAMAFPLARRKDKFTFVLFSNKHHRWLHSSLNAKHIIYSGNFLQWSAISLKVIDDIAWIQCDKIVHVHRMYVQCMLYTRKKFTGSVLCNSSYHYKSVYY